MAAESTPVAASRDNPILETRGLTKRFGELMAVDQVDLTVHSGEFHSVIGPNGAGKTTLFNLITGPIRPSAGAVFFEGSEITQDPVHERIRRGIARSFQLSNIFSGLTVRENVRLAAQAVDYRALSGRQTLFQPPAAVPDIDARADQILERIDLDGQAEAPAAALSYGDQRRLELGLVLATDPEVVLLDEPTAGMSGEETERTINLIHDILADKTLVLVEHNIDLVMEVSDTITVLHQGQCIANGPPEAISDEEEVQRAYLGGHA
ncbi:MAG: ABC transporter ATP-binding protein [Halobacteriales archaeon]